MPNRKKRRARQANRAKRVKQQVRQVSQSQQDPLLPPPGDFTLDECVTLLDGNPPIVDTKKMLWMYYVGKYTEVLQLVINVAAVYEQVVFAKLSSEAQGNLDTFVQTTLYIISQPDFIVSTTGFAPLMQAAPVLNNLVAMSSFRDTDGFLRTVLTQQGNFFKVLPFCTIRNTAQLNIEGLFETNPELASMWWLQYGSAIAGLTRELTYKNARRWLASIPEKLVLPDWRCVPLYFNATYIDPDKDRLIKKRMNERIQKHIPTFPLPIVNKPTPKRIAIVSSRWYPTSAVYKTSQPHIQALKDRGYKMDLVHLGPRHVDSIICREDFNDVKYVSIGQAGFKYEEIADNDYSAIYFTDIGMNNESIWLSNMRLAPVQIMGLGHPVSTFGSNIDYIITGAEVEHPNLLLENYSERVVLIPGLGATPVDPKYTLRQVEKAAPEFLINCCWTAPKITYPMLQALVEIKKRAKRRVVYHFLPSWTVGRQNSAIPFLRDVRALFGDDVLVTSEQPYHDYLERMEAGHLSLVPHPFGGYNTVIDSFAVGLPCVAIEGTKWYNRCAPGLLRRCGFDDLITDSIEDYITKTVEIINNESYRLELVDRLALVDFEKTLYQTEDTACFVDAIDYVIANHSQLQLDTTRTPIRIGC